MIKAPLESEAKIRSVSRHQHFLKTSLKSLHNFANKQQKPGVKQHNFGCSMATKQILFLMEKKSPGMRADSVTLSSFAGLSRACLFSRGGGGGGGVAITALLRRCLIN